MCGAGLDLGHALCLGHAPGVAHETQCYGMCVVLLWSWHCGCHGARKVVGVASLTAVGASTESICHYWEYLWHRIGIQEVLEGFKCGHV